MQINKIGLFCAHSFTKPGGVQNHVIELYKEFSKRGIPTKIIAPGRAKPHGVRERDVITIGVSTYIPANQSKADFSVSIRSRFRKRILAEGFDILHFHNIGMGPLSYQILRNSHATHILTVHSSSDGSSIGKIPLIRTFIHRIYEKKFNGLIAVSPPAMQTIESFGGFHNGPTTLIPNGINLSRFQCGVSDTPHVGYPIPHITLLFVGRFEKRKGLLQLLRTFHILVHRQGRKNLRLLIVGDGEQRNEAQKFVHDNSLLPFARFFGSVSDERLAHFYRTADIFCAPSLRGESFGITLLEAMACGTPIVGFANPGYSYVMQGHEKAFGTNLLAAPGDCAALAEKIVLLIDNRDKRKQAISWGLEHVQQFAWPKIADKTLNFYEEAYRWQKNKGIATLKM